MYIRDTREGVMGEHVGILCIYAQLETPPDSAIRYCLNLPYDTQY